MMTSNLIPTKPPLVMYHSNCVDGFGAAFAAWRCYGDNAVYMQVSYGDFTLPMLQEDHEFLLNREVYILDFSFSREVMDFIFKICTKVIWLDHHKTAFELYGKEPNELDSQPIYGLDIGIDIAHYIELNNCKSGAMLAWNWFNLHAKVPKLIQHIDDYDRWQFKLPDTKAFNKFLWSLTPWTFEQWNKLLDMPQAEIAGAYMAGEAILRAHDRTVESVIAASKMSCTITWFEATEISNRFDSPYKQVISSREVGAVGLAANCPKHLASDVGHKLATESTTYGMCWFQRSDSKIEVSLRSNGNYDVSAIAKKFGGGGHKNAAGFILPSMSLLQKFFYPDRRSI